jgi:hypothetical protein
MMSVKLTTVAKVVATISILLFAIACRKYQTIRTTGDVAAVPGDMRGLEGPGIWIRHDGFQSTDDDGKSHRIDGMRAPFDLADPKLIEGLKVGDPVEFEFRLFKGRGLFELTEIKKRPAAPPR